jgi:hypothetical protein
MEQEIIEQEPLMEKKKIDTTTILLYIIGILLVIYVSVVIFTPKEKLKEPTDVTKNINILKKDNVRLTEAQKKLDSINQVYDVQIDSIDSKINNLKIRTIIVKKYYTKTIAAPKSYTTDQVDSFFKSRYKY